MKGRSDLPSPCREKRTLRRNRLVQASAEGRNPDRFNSGVLVRFLILALCGFLAAGSAVAQQPGAAPQWFLDDIKSLSAEGGRWVADNSAYKSDSEPFDAYGTQWVSGFDGHTMTGRLFGVKEGKDLAFDFWEFRQYWRPDTQEAVVEQFGWGGALGLGVLRQGAPGAISDQTFFNADGSVARTGHKSHFPDKDTYVTESFDIVGDVWTPRRKYVWKRQSTDKK